MQQVAPSGGVLDTWAAPRPQLGWAGSRARVIGGPSAWRTPAPAPRFDRHASGVRVDLRTPVAPRRLQSQLEPVCRSRPSGE